MVDEEPDRHAQALQALGRGSRSLHPRTADHWRTSAANGDEIILVVENLSRLAACFELDRRNTAAWCRWSCRAARSFPVIGERPTFELGDSSRSMFKLWSARSPPALTTQDAPMIEGRSWEEIFDVRNRDSVERAFAAYLPTRRWFGSKARSIAAINVRDAAELPNNTRLAIIHVEFHEGEPQTYQLPLGIANVRREQDQTRNVPVIARLREGAVLYEPVQDEGFANGLLDTIARKRQLPRSASDGRCSDSCVQGAPRHGESRDARARRRAIEYRHHLRPAAVSETLPPPGERHHTDAEITKFLDEETSFRNAPRRRGRSSIGRTPPARRPPRRCCRATRRTPATPGPTRSTPSAAITTSSSAIPKPARTSPGPSDRQHHGAGSQAGAGSRPRDHRQLSGRRRAARKTHRATASRAGIAERHPGLRAGGVHAALSTLDLPIDAHADRADHAGHPQEREDESGVGGSAGEGRLAASAGARGAPRKDGSRAYPRPGYYHLGRVLTPATNFVSSTSKASPRPPASAASSAAPARRVAGMLRSFHYAPYAVVFGTAPDRMCEPRIGRGSKQAHASGQLSRIVPARVPRDSTTGTPAAQAGVKGDAVERLPHREGLYEIVYALNTRPDWVQIPMHGLWILVT